MVIVGLPVMVPLIVPLPALTSPLLPLTPYVNTQPRYTHNIHFKSLLSPEYIRYQEQLKPNYLHSVIVISQNYEKHRMLE